MTDDEDWPDPSPNESSGGITAGLVVVGFILFVSSMGFYHAGHPVLSFGLLVTLAGVAVSAVLAAAIATVLVEAE